MTGLVTFLLVVAGTAAAVYCVGYMGLANRDQLLQELYNRPAEKDAWVMVAADRRTGDLKTIFAIRLTQADTPRLLNEAKRFLKEGGPS